MLCHVAAIFGFWAVPPSVSLDTLLISYKFGIIKVRHKLVCRYEALQVSMLELGVRRDTAALQGVRVIGFTTSGIACGATCSKHSARRCAYVYGDELE